MSDISGSTMSIATSSITLSLFFAFGTFLLTAAEARDSGPAAGEVVWRPGFEGWENPGESQNIRGLRPRPPWRGLARKSRPTSEGLQARHQNEESDFRKSLDLHLQF